MFKIFKPHSLVQHLILSVLLIALVPLSFLSAHLYHAAWDNSWREIREKHQLIAENLALPLTVYIDDHRNMLALTAERLLHKKMRNHADVEHILFATLKNTDGFNSLTLLDDKGHILGLTQHLRKKHPDLAFIKKRLSREKTYLQTLKTGKGQLSGIKRCLIGGEPTLVLSYPVYSKQKKLVGVILSELKVGLIEKLRRNVKFGVKGHSAIVDQYGHVIAHPNPVWMEEMRDISHLSVVKLMMAGKTGVTTFYSPFIKQNMVAGYTSVPKYGWGIMVPQPESEVVAQVRRLMYSNLIWGLIGVLFAIVLAIILARWINNPINRLAAAGNALLKNNLIGDLGESHKNDPYEVKQLNSVIRSLVFSLQRSQQELQELNDSLNLRIEEATKRLRESNTQLENTVKSDYLTSLSNRRHFEDVLSKIARQRSTDSKELSIMLLDIDNFKLINDQFGHAGGDRVLIAIAQLLMDIVRAEDMVARYAGDEFVLILQCNVKMALKRAEQIRADIENLVISCEGNMIKTTVSIGVHYCNNIHELDVSKVMLQVDEAMYKAKQEGRNRIVAI